MSSQNSKLRLPPPSPVTSTTTSNFLNSSQNGFDDFSLPSLKIVIIGDMCAGKSSLLLSYCSDQFLLRTQTTLGADFQVQTIPKKCVATFWDLQGQEDPMLTPPNFVRHASAVILVVDCAKVADEQQQQHHNHNHENGGNTSPFVVLDRSHSSSMSSTYCSEMSPVLPSVVSSSRKSSVLSEAATPPPMKKSARLTPKKAHNAVNVVSNRVRAWINFLRVNGLNNVPVILCGNKIDLVVGHEDEQSFVELAIKAIQRNNGISELKYTSALTKEGVEDLFTCAVDHAVEYWDEIGEKLSEAVSTQQRNPHGTKCKSPCCS
eukprot:PhM_4_TR6809/c0_g1_i1/m.59485